MVWVGALQIMLDKGKELDWFASDQIVALAVVAVVGFVAFLIWELTESTRSSTCACSAIATSPPACSTIARRLRRSSSATSCCCRCGCRVHGLHRDLGRHGDGSSGVLAVLLAPIVGQLMAKVDPRRLVFFGLLWLGVVTLWRTRCTTDMTYWQIAPAAHLHGLGLPFFFVPLTALALGSVEEHETAVGGGTA